MNLIYIMIKTILLFIINLLLIFNSSNATNIDENLLILKDKIDFSQIQFIAPATGITKEKVDFLKQVFPIDSAGMFNDAIIYHAADDTTRARNLVRALNSNAKYLWSIRGGYGSARLCECLESLKNPKDQKIIIGYSDVTFLHLYVNKKWNWKSIHASMPIGIKSNEKNFTLLAKILSKKKGMISYNSLKPLNKKAKATTTISGELIGGNLGLIANSIGTSWQLDGKNKILFIEDICIIEDIIDRNLHHLNQAGVFKDVNAIFLGKFVSWNDSGKAFNYAIERFANEINIPVFYSPDFGHGFNNYPLPLGFKSTILKKKEEENFTIEIPYDFS